jgi:hypothetical protein
MLQLIFEFVTGQGTDQQPFLVNRGCRGDSQQPIRVRA